MHRNTHLRVFQAKVSGEVSKDKEGAGAVGLPQRTRPKKAIGDLDAARPIVPNP